MKIKQLIFIALSRFTCVLLKKKKKANFAWPHSYEAGVIHCAASNDNFPQISSGIPVPLEHS